MVEGVSLMGEVDQPPCRFTALPDELDFGMMTSGIVEVDEALGKVGMVSQLFVFKRGFEFGLVATDQRSFMGRGGVGCGRGNFGLGGMAQSPEFGEEFLHWGGGVNTVAG